MSDLGKRWAEGCACGAHYSVAIDGGMSSHPEPEELALWRVRHRLACRFMLTLEEKRELQHG